MLNLKYNIVMKEWTHKDRQYLKDNYSNLPVRVMAEHLGRTENSIRKQVQY